VFSKAASSAVADCSNKVSPQGRTRRWRLWLILASLYAVIIVIATEVGVRWLVPVPDQFFVSDPVVGIRHIAGRSGRWTSPEFDVPVRINQLGFRDRERTEAKSVGTRRIVVLGDSITEALQVPLEATFPAVTEARLAGGRTPVEVLNLGVSATGTGQQYLLFHERGRRLSPDVVVLAFFTGNDVRNNSRALNPDTALPYPVIGPEGRLAREPDGTPRFSPVQSTGSVRQFLRERLTSYRFFAARSRGIGPLTARLPRFFTAADASANAHTAADEETSLGHYREAPSPAWREAYDATFELLADLEAEVRRAGAVLFVVVIPAPWELSVKWQRVPMTGSGWDLERPERALMEILRARHVPALSVRNLLRAEMERGNDIFFAADGHLNPRGHRIIGEALAAVLREHYGPF
jgi:lysophospholipase L1-like esterase